MRAFAAVALLLAACTQPQVANVTVTAMRASPPMAHGRVDEVTFHSRALDVDKRYFVYLPAGYDTLLRRFPVVYLLHGLGGDERDWIDQGHLPEAADRIGLAAMVVMPDGDESFYVNSVTPADYANCVKLARHDFAGRRETAASFCVRHADYETYVARDLVDDVDARFRTVATRQARGIAGLSMGGFGALMLAMRHLDRFSAAASHSGLDALLYAGPHPYRKGHVQLATDVSHWGAEVEPIGALVRRIFGPDLARFRAHDPAALATTLSDGQLAIYLDCGTEDNFGLEDEAAYLHDVLASRHISHEFALVPGRHDWRLWRARIPVSLAFFAAHFQHAGF
ncbi:MAG TPA: alpha/beta hydrolase family protein [Polyangia bacterium]|jgi:S-formylglutathione hydrolase FrmB